MDVPLSPIRSQKAYRTIVRTIVGLIARGELEYGNRLYNEQELMAMLGVSRPTLREALRVLEFLGIATVAPRRGILINQPQDSEGYLPLLSVLLFERITDRELFELRQALQIEAVGHAAERSSTKQAAVLDEINLRLEALLNQTPPDPVQFADIDYEFHEQVASMAENRLGKKLMNTFGVLMRGKLLEISRAITPELRKKTLSFHREIARQISLHDPETARRVMREHLDRPYRTMTGRPVGLPLSGEL